MDFITFLLLLGAVLMIVLNLFAIYWFGPMLLPIIGGGGPYVPTPVPTLEIMLRLANISPTDSIVDLGSGDGRMVIEAAKRGARSSMGCEIHPGLVKLSNERIKKAGLQKIASVKRQSMWNVDVRDATIVFIYQIPYAMKKLGDKLKAELPPGARIIVSAFPIPEWTPVQQEGQVYLYKT
mgnify:FL=1